MEYIDDYGTCEDTYVTLLVYPGDVASSEVSFAFDLKPTRECQKQEIPSKRINGWFYSTKGLVESRDCRRHIDFILDKIIFRKDAISELKKKGVKISMSCCWHSKSGHGGPIISSHQMRRLVELDIELWWDVYFADEE